MNSLDLVRDRFAELVTGPHPLTLDGARFPRLPHRLLPLDEVRDMLLTRQCPQATSDAVWAHLVESARTQRAAWIEAALGVALPALTSVAARLARQCPGDPADLHAEVLRGFLEALTTIDLTKPRIMLRLRWAAYRAGGVVVKEMLASRAHRSERAVGRPAPGGHPDFVLIRAVADGVLTKTEADLIGATRLESVPISRWAADHYKTDWATYKARRRAELRLVAYLNGDAIDTSHRQKSAQNVSKTDPDFGLETGREIPRPTPSSEVRTCA